MIAISLTTRLRAQSPNFGSGLGRNILNPVLRRDGNQVLYVLVRNLGRGRQSQRGHGCAELFEVSFQPGWGQQDQHAHLIGMDLKGVRDVTRTENQRAGRAADGLIADPRGDLAFKDVEALVLVAVDVARRAIVLAGECID